MRKWVVKSTLRKSNTHHSSIQSLHTHQILSLVDSQLSKGIQNLDDSNPNSKLQNQNCINTMLRGEGALSLTSQCPTWPLMAPITKTNTFPSSFHARPPSIFYAHASFILSKPMGLHPSCPSKHKRVINNWKNSQLYSSTSDAPSSFTEEEPAPMADLFEFICRGPLLAKLGANADDIAQSIDLWLETGNRVCSLLGFNELKLTQAQRVRIFHYYVPVYVWCLRQLECHRAQFQGSGDVPPLLFGVSAPQGSGKTTLVYALEYLFNRSGRKATSISIDDFYLTAPDQGKLAAENAGNKLLELRGNAGTHDLALGTSTLQSLCSLSKQGTKAKIPRYDKSANIGRGDRADPSTWPEIEGPLEVAFLEGWMLGFKPLPSEAVKNVDQQLEAVNKNLEQYHDSWERFISSWIIIKVDKPEWVYKWRLQAEIAMKADGKSGMSDEEVFDFVSRYMPAYKAYLKDLYAEGPRNSKPEHTLIVEVDENRNPIC